ncbi:hypothetical protein HDU96_004352 [Phlyctochytrium bullatum]|nr:hypothetical protein HDU96_004352 [Phlyctochytrium bullatum]
MTPSPFPPTSSQRPPPQLRKRQGSSSTSSASSSSILLLQPHSHPAHLELHQSPRRDSHTNCSNTGDSDGKSWSRHILYEYRELGIPHRIGSGNSRNGSNVTTRCPENFTRESTPDPIALHWAEASRQQDRESFFSDATFGFRPSLATTAASVSEEGNPWKSRGVRRPLSAKHFSAAETFVATAAPELHRKVYAAVPTEPYTVATTATPESGHAGGGGGGEGGGGEAGGVTKGNCAEESKGNCAEESARPERQKSLTGPGTAGSKFHQVSVPCESPAVRQFQPPSLIPSLKRWTPGRVEVPGFRDQASPVGKDSGAEEEPDGTDDDVDSATSARTSIFIHRSRQPSRRPETRQKKRRVSPPPTPSTGSAFKPESYTNSVQVKFQPVDATALQRVDPPKSVEVQQGRLQGIVTKGVSTSAATISGTTSDPFKADAAPAAGYRPSSSSENTTQSNQCSSSTSAHATEVATFSSLERLYPMNAAMPSPAPSTSSPNGPSASASPSPVVEVPEFFHLIDSAVLTHMIADMLCRLTAHNDQIPLTQSNLTRFHSRAPPAISIGDYLKRIVKYASVERVCLLILLIYIDRVCERNRAFTISSLTVHRFIITGVTVGSKALCDSFLQNSMYAKVGGISTKELNILELEFLFLIDWDLTASAERLQEYYLNLVRQHPHFKRANPAAVPSPPLKGEAEIASTTPSSTSATASSSSVAARTGTRTASGLGVLNNPVPQVKSAAASTQEDEDAENSKQLSGRPPSAGSQDRAGSVAAAGAVAGGAQASAKSRFEVTAGLASVVPGGTRPVSAGAGGSASASMDWVDCVD